MLLSSCNFKKEVSYAVTDKNGNIIAEDVIEVKTRSSYSAKDCTVTCGGSGGYSAVVDFCYENGVYTFDFKIEDDLKKTLKTVSFMDVQPQEFKLGNGYLVKINMKEKNQPLGLKESSYFDHSTK